MIIIQNYDLVPDEGKENVYYVRNREEVRCPDCNRKMRVIGSRVRVVREMDGNSRHLIIRRFRCIMCSKVHHELPDVLVPYRRWSAQTVEAVLIQKEEKTYPCDNSTAYRLRRFYSLRRRFAARCRLFAVKYREHFCAVLQTRLA